MISLDDDHGPSEPGAGAGGIGEFSPPDLALRDLYHSLRSRIRREAALTNESVLSHQVNDVLKALTAISVVVLPLTLVASVWGMNVGVPGEHSHTAFWIVLGAMVGLLAGMLGFFRSRGWL